ncbi:hypothetical protein PM082_003224 [Marasmius tenuissimus]|nr:hypothetical protein PM082_009097 [Marasmius tenuissimus]KAJ8084454.1 hypothetical protein PM082_003224 [Marasmius tenuissimus]
MDQQPNLRHNTTNPAATAWATTRMQQMRYGSVATSAGTVIQAAPSIKFCQLWDLCKTRRYPFATVFQEVVCGPPNDSTKTFVRRICDDCMLTFGSKLSLLRLCYNDNTCSKGGVFCQPDFKWCKMVNENKEIRRLCPPCSLRYKEEHPDLPVTFSSTVSARQTTVYPSPIHNTANPIGGIRRANIDAQRGRQSAPPIQGIPRPTAPNPYVEAYHQMVNKGPRVQTMPAPLPPPPIRQQGYTAEHASYHQEVLRQREKAFATSFHLVTAKATLFRTNVTGKTAPQPCANFIMVTNLPVNIGTLELKERIFQTLFSDREGNEGAWTLFLQTLAKWKRPLMPTPTRDWVDLVDKLYVPFPIVPNNIPNFYPTFFKPLDKKSANQGFAGSLGQFKNNPPPFPLGLVIKQVFSIRIEQVVQMESPPEEMSPSTQIELSGEYANSRGSGSWEGFVAYPPSVTASAAVSSKATKPPTPSKPGLRRSKRRKQATAAAEKSVNPTISISSSSDDSDGHVKKKTRQSRRNATGTKSAGSKKNVPSCSDKSEPAETPYASKSTSIETQLETHNVPKSAVTVSNSHLHGTKDMTISSTPDISQLALAMNTQERNSNRECIFNNFVTKTVHVMKAKVFTLDELIKSQVDQQQDPRLHLLESPTLLHLSYSNDVQKAYGGFKFSWIASATPPLFSSSTSEICVKQTYEKTVVGNKVIGKTRRGEDQYKNLESEVLSMIWGSTLYNRSVAFAEDMHSQGLVQDIDRPKQLGFARCAIGMEMDGSTRNYFMFEEVVQPPFVKFLNNSTVQIPSYVMPGDQAIAEWLSFTQHAQYMLTGKMAFIGDYQGNHTYLTDPQIITHPALQHTFASGNNPECYWDMEQWHECGRYCKHYGLEDSPEAWDAIEKAPLLRKMESQLDIQRPKNKYRANRE